MSGEKEGGRNSNWRGGANPREIEEIKREIRELRASLMRATRLTAWDQLLFAATSFITFIFSVMQALLPSGHQAILSFLPLAITGLIMPLYVGYYRGSLLLDSILERMRGWMYLLFSLGVYAVNLLESSTRFSEYVSSLLERALAESTAGLPLMEVISLVAFAFALLTRKPLYIMAMLSIPVTAFLLPSYLPIMIVLITELSLAYYFMPSYLVSVFRFDYGLEDGGNADRAVEVLRRTGTGAYLLFLFSALVSNHVSSCISSGSGIGCYLVSALYSLPFLLPGLWYEGLACWEVISLEGGGEGLESVTCRWIYRPVLELASKLGLSLLQGGGDVDS